jgi:hypothetical protein
MRIWQEIISQHYLITLVGWAIASAILILIGLPFKRASNPQKMEQAIRQQTADIPVGNYLFLRCSGDEAAAALSTAQLVAWAGNKVFRFLRLVTRPFFLVFDQSAAGGWGPAIGFLSSIVVMGAVAYGLLHVLPDVFKFGIRGYFFSPNGPFVAKLDYQQMKAIVYTLVSVVAVSLLLLCVSAMLLIFLHKRSHYGLLDGRGCLPASWSS